MVSEIVLEPATAVIVPPKHPPTKPFGVATTRPAGNGSVKLTPVRLFPIPVERSNVRVLVSVIKIDVGANFFVNVGA